MSNDFPDAANPFQSPQTKGELVSAPPADAKPRKPPYALFYSSMAINMVVPMLFAWQITENVGRYGLLCGIICVGIPGYWLCRKGGIIVKPTLVGSEILAVTQFMPVVQLFAGLVALWVASRIELLLYGETGAVPLNSEAGFYCATLITGTLLIVASCGIGLFLRLITPNRWWNEEPNLSIATMTQPTVVSNESTKEVASTDPSGNPFADRTFDE